MHRGHLLRTVTACRPRTSPKPGDAGGHPAGPCLLLGELFRLEFRVRSDTGSFVSKPNEGEISPTHSNVWLVWEVG